MYEFEPQHDPKNLEIALERWEDLRHKCGFVSNSLFLSPKGRERLQFNRECHSYLGHDYDMPDEMDVYVTEVPVDRTIKAWKNLLEKGLLDDNWSHGKNKERAAEQLPSNGEITPELYRPYLDWLIGESHFRNLFLTPDVDDVCKHQRVAISVDVPGQLLFAASVAVRMPWECSPIAFEMFNELKELYGGAIAFPLVIGTNLSVWGRPSYHGPFVQAYSGHRPFGCPSTMENLNNWLNANWTGLNKETWRTNHNYRNTCTIHGDDTYYRDFFGDTLIQEDQEALKALQYFRAHGKLKGEEEDDALPIIIPNPFRRLPFFRNKNPNDNRNKGNFTYGEIRDFLLPYLIDQGDIERPFSGGEKDAKL